MTSSNDILRVVRDLERDMKRLNNETLQFYKLITDNSELTDDPLMVVIIDLSLSHLDFFMGAVNSNIQTLFMMWYQDVANAERIEAEKQIELNQEKENKHESNRT